MGPLGLTRLGRRGCEEFERDVVRVSERQPRPVTGIHDAAVLDAELVEPRLPLGQFIAVRTAEGEVVQPDPAFVELVTTWGPFVEPMQAQQEVTYCEDDMSERSRVLIQHGVTADESLVPGNATRQITDGYDDVGYWWKVRHGNLLQSRDGLDAAGVVVRTVVPPRSFQDHVSLRILKGRCMTRPASRLASVMSRRPARWWAPTARLRRPAMTRGPDLVRTVELSSR